MYMTSVSAGMCPGTLRQALEVRKAWMGPEDRWVRTGSVRLEPSDRVDSNINATLGEEMQAQASRKSFPQRLIEWERNTNLQRERSTEQKGWRFGECHRLENNPNFWMNSELWGRNIESDSGFKMESLQCQPDL